MSTTTLSAKEIIFGVHATLVAKCLRSDRERVTLAKAFLDSPQEWELEEEAILVTIRSFVNDLYRAIQITANAQEHEKGKNLETLDLESKYAQRSSHIKNDFELLRDLLTVRGVLLDINDNRFIMNTQVSLYKLIDKTMFHIISNLSEWQKCRRKDKTEILI